MAAISGRIALRDRLVALAAEYPPKAATVDLTVLRRDAHTRSTRPSAHQHGWQALGHLDQRALSSVRDHITRAMAHAAYISTAATFQQPVIEHAKGGVVVAW